MLLAIDAGNTNIVFAVYNGLEKMAQWRGETGAGCAVALSEVASKYSNIEAVIISSVVPKMNDSLIRHCQIEFDINPVFITHENAGIVITIDHPEQVGADRLVDAVAVLAHYQYPAVIVDFGTATTFDVVDAQGRYCGGVIAPGVNLSLEALYLAAAKLPKVDVAHPEKVIGRNTKDAMQSGIYFGYLGLIEGVIKRISEDMGVKPYIIGTGGLAPLFAEGTDIIDIIDPDLIMKGLVHIYEQNNHGNKKKRA